MEDEFLKNFGMIIPLEATKLEEIKADPNGVPIYAGCPSDGLCACTGRCKKIIGYNTDPDKIKACHEDIERRNNYLAKRRASFFGNFKYFNEEGGNRDGKTRTWTWEKPDTNK